MTQVYDPSTDNFNESGNQTSVLTDAERDALLVQVATDVEYIKGVLSQIQKGVGTAMENPSIKAMARNFGVEL